MTRAPLMLSDTAMMLLRQYHELEESYCAFEEEKIYLEKFNPRRFDSIHIKEWLAISFYHSSWERHEIQRYLMHEIWLLWSFPDIPLIRHMDWHMAFNKPLMTMAEKTFIPPDEYPRLAALFMTRTPGMLFMTRQRNDTRWFLETLDIAYTKALAIHLQTKTTP
jgi:hypothetical protein